MKLSTFTLAFSSLAAVCGAWPTYGPGCLTQAEATLIVNRYADVIAHQPSDLGNASVTAAAITDANYTETSDSANIILGLPVLCSLIAVAIGMNLISFQLGGYTVPNKTAFVILSQLDPPVNSTTISIQVACHNITWQWVYPTFGDGQYEVKGFHLFLTDAKKLLKAAFFEFNSIAGALDTGYGLKLPNGTIQT